MINIATAEEIRRRHTSDVKSESTNQTVHKEDQQKHEMSEVKQSSIKKISPPLVANCQRRARMIQPERNEPINRSHFYSFKGNVVKLAMDLLVSGSRPDLEAIIADVREMLSDLEGRLVKLNRTRQSRKMEASA
jgi:DNA-binding TFAR19-related protein (PDSD5 family)